MRICCVEESHHMRLGRNALQTCGWAEPLSGKDSFSKGDCGQRSVYKALGMPWVPVCNRGQGRVSFYFFSFLFCFVFFPRTIKTSERELIDSPIDSPMDASILLIAKQLGGHIKYGQCAEQLDWFFYDGRISQQTGTCFILLLFLMFLFFFLFFLR